ncbi:MAG TPA: hypothetical protein VFR05_04085, partial [Terriglobia bacterium]|nr:hypothetical protein [Terriglobia bacterium]
MVTVVGSDGAFAFRGIPPGSYVIEASRSGYISEMAGTLLAGASESGSVVADRNTLMVQQLTPGQQLTLRLGLTPGGVITGRLADERGEAVAGAVVQALKAAHKDGIREWTLVQSVVSNDLGEYRFFTLKPGQYRVALMPPSVWIPGVSPPAISIPLFYPGTVDATAAATIDLSVGQTIERLDFLSIPTKNRRITGTVQGNGSDGVNIVLSPLNGTSKKTVFIKGDTPNPTFEFSDVVPGNYTLVAYNVHLRTVLPLDVRSADLLGVRVVLGQGIRMPTRVRIEGHPPGNDPELEELYFDARPDVPITGLDTQRYAPFSDGRLILDLLQTDYWIDLVRPDGYYVKSITLNGVDVLNQGLHAVSSVDGPMEIVVDNRVGAVQGRTAAPNATVVLVPEAPRGNQRALYRSIKTTNGAFRFDKVPPGEYKLFAWSEDKIDNGGPWRDPEYLRRYEAMAVPVRIEEGQSTVLERLVPVF